MKRQSFGAMIKFSATLVAICTITLIIIIGPFFAPPGYSSISHPISQMAAQSTANAWLMRTGLLALGIGPGIDALFRLRRQPVRAVFFLGFTAAMICTAIFSARPIDPGLAFDRQEDGLHALAAIIAGYAFAAGALCFVRGQQRHWQRAFSVFAAACAAFIPVLMYFFPEIMGALQRFMLGTCFIWLVRFLPLEGDR